LSTKIVLDKELKDFCIKCGRCCKIFVVRYPGNKTLYEFLSLRYGTGIRADQVDLDIKEDAIRIVFKIPCKFLGPEGCLIYDDRPKSCKDYYCEETKDRYETWKSLRQGNSEKSF